MNGKQIEMHSLIIKNLLLRNLLTFLECQSVFHEWTVDTHNCHHRAKRIQGKLRKIFAVKSTNYLEACQLLANGKQMDKY